MKMVFRWFGEGNDSVSLSQIKQIPGVKGIVWALHDIPPVEIWPLERMQAVKKQADENDFSRNESAGLGAMESEGIRFTAKWISKR